MCGIAGIFYKDARQHDVGDALIQMLYGCQHRGKDSTGFALYGDVAIDQLVLRFLVEADETGGVDAAIDHIKSILTEYSATIVEEHAIANNYRVKVIFTGDIRTFSYALEHAAKVISIGSSLDIIKDIGTAHDVDELYHVRESPGTHGIGHVRLATESDVKAEAAHPFWATGFADIAIVHNGQITNYWKMRRSLESKDFEFRTENDSELIAVFLAQQLADGTPLEEVLANSIEILDGTFSFLVSTRDELGYAKDHLAAKPMVMCETDGLVAIASEEVSLNRLFPGETITTTEPLPGTYHTWSK
jgi:glutamate synthase domain-containing protein 1